MRVITVILYFIFAIIILGAIGIILPYIFDNMNEDKNILKNLNQNIITYFIAILVASSLDYVLKLINDKASHQKPAILCICVVNTIIFSMTSYILYQNSKDLIKGVSFWALTGVALSWLMWWIANYRNSAFDVNSNSTLGGDTDKPLTNG